jgi:hypothetical protein
VQGSRSAEFIVTIGGNLQLDLRNILGKGGYVVVYTGTFNDEKVAVKRVQLVDSADNRELENNQKLSRLDHPNIVQFKHYEQDYDYK